MTGSSLARRTLGQRLRVLREKAKVSQSAAARAVELSPQSIGRLEEGDPTRVSSLHINVLCDRYAVDDTERKVLLKLAHEARKAQKSGGHWWYAYADLSPDGFDHYVVLEETACRLTSFQPTMVPGLLQTAGYRRAGEWTMHPRDSVSEVDRRVEMFVRRQQRLYDPHFEVRMFMLESALYHPVGGPEVMETQLEHLDEIGQLPNVSIRIIPRAASGHVGLHVGPFVLLEFITHSTAEESNRPLVYVEGFTGDLYLERTSEIHPYWTALQDIDRVALDEGRSRDLIGQIAREYQV